MAGTAGVYATLRAEVSKRNLSGVAVRCWPEFFTELGCAACGAMSILGEESCPASCEADVNGTVTTLLLQHLAGAPDLEIFGWIVDVGFGVIADQLRRRLAAGLVGQIGEFRAVELRIPG